MALAASVEHHVFNSRLAGQDVDAARFNQDTNLLIGNILSYIVRGACSLSIGAAYWQLFWTKVQSHPARISVIDALHGILWRPEEFFRFSALRKSPLLYVVAFLSWVVPWVTVLPQATLSVHVSSSSHPENATLQIPDWDKVAYRMQWTDWEGASAWLSRTALGTAFQGKLPNLPPPVQNSSYGLDFYAPGVSCSPFYGDDDFWTTINTGLEGCDGNTTRCGTNKSNFYGYLAWVPFQTAMVPWHANEGFISVTETMGSFNGSETEILIATSSIETNDWDVWKILSCKMFNASWAVNFTFSGQEQHIGWNFDKVNSIYLSGDATYYPATLSYFSMMDVLGRALAGTIWGSAGSEGERLFMSVDHTSILDTELARTKEVAPIFDFILPDSPLSDGDYPVLETVIPLMFANMTLSLFSAPELFLSDQDHTTRILVTRFFNAYEYNWRRLVIAYGVVLFLTATVVISACISLLKSKLSYSNKFSTMLRMTREDSLNHLILAADRGGEDPVPKHIAKARVWIGRESHGEAEAELESLNPKADTESVQQDNASIVSRFPSMHKF